MKFPRRFTQAGEEPLRGHRSGSRGPPRSAIRTARSSSASRTSRSRRPGRRSRPTCSPRSTSGARASRRSTSTGSPRLDEAGQPVLGGRERRPPGLPPARRLLDPLGPRARLLRRRGGRPGLPRRALPHARRPALRPEQPAVVQHRPPLGLRHRRPAPGAPLRGPGHGPARSSSESAYERPQPHACFIQQVKDDLVGPDGIMDLWVREGRLFKYGSGTGTNFSALRGDGEPLSGGGRSSGPHVVPQDRRPGRRRHQVRRHHAPRRQDGLPRHRPPRHRGVRRLEGRRGAEGRRPRERLEVAREEPQRDRGGVSRRGGRGSRTPSIRSRTSGCACAMREAKRCMVPPNYVQRAIQLAQQGYRHLEIPTYTTDWDGEAYLTVSGQNSNNSVRLPNEFMRAVEEDLPWDLIRRTDRQVSKTVPARKLWDKITYSAWACADPGVQYDTTINEWHTCPKDGRINASNPCSEYMFLDDTACNLASLNLVSFFDGETGAFDVDGFKHAIRLWTVVLEISVLMAQYPSREIARRSYVYRTLGLGYANIGSLLMRLGLPYDSRRGARVERRAHGHPHRRGVRDLGRDGRVPGALRRATSRNRKDMLRVIRNHRRAAYNATRRRVRGADRHPDGPRPGVLPREPPLRGPRRLGPGARARQAARLPQRPGVRPRADGHDRPRHGLRHDGHRARLRAREVQEAGRRRLLPDHQRRGAHGAEAPRLQARAGRRHHPLRPRHGHPAGRALHRRREPARQGLHARGPRDDRGAAALGVRHLVRDQPLDARRRVPPGHARHRRGGLRARPTSTSSATSASAATRSGAPTTTSAAP